PHGDVGGGVKGVKSVAFWVRSASGSGRGQVEGGADSVDIGPERAGDLQLLLELAAGVHDRGVVFLAQELGDGGVGEASVLPEQVHGDMAGVGLLTGALCSTDLAPL